MPSKPLSLLQPSFQKSTSLKTRPVFLFGGTSILGWNLFLNHRDKNLVPFCNSHAKEPECRNWRRLDIEDERGIQDLFNKERPRILVHCAGVCDVDQAEVNPAWAYKINVTSVETLLRYLPKETRLIYCSSDHVFSGNGGCYDEQTEPDPLTVYGKTRVKAERLILKERPHSLVIRYGLGIGMSIDNKTGHLNWLQYRHKNKFPITVVEDEYRSVVWARDLANRVMELANTRLSGIRHVVGERMMSRLELATFLNKKYKIGAKINVEKRKDRAVPHLGRVNLATCHTDPYAKNLKSVDF